MRVTVGFFAGLMFGIGLTVSQMIDPAKVLAFLDVAAVRTGGWDPSLALVMVAALAVTAAGYRWAFRRGAPVLAAGFSIPEQRRIDPRLLAGAALFGTGWGLAGLCPGPAVAALATGNARVALFVVAMLGGMALCRFVLSGRS